MEVGSAKMEVGSAKMEVWSLWCDICVSLL